MRNMILALSVLFTILLFTGINCVADELTIEFTYDVTPLPETYKWYLDNKSFCEFPENGSKRATCSFADLAYGDHKFTLSAISKGIESPRSPEYTFTKSMKAPTIDKIFMITISITEGK